MALTAPTVLVLAAGGEPWETRRSQPGVLLAIKANERLVTPGPPATATWAPDNGGIVFWKGATGDPVDADYWAYFRSELEVGYPESWDLSSYDTSVKPTGSFRITYPGSSPLGAQSTFAIHTNFRCPPRYAPQKQLVNGLQWPNQIDARYPSKEWDPTLNPWDPAPGPAHSAGKGAGSECWIQFRWRCESRFILPYALGGPIANIATATWAGGEVTVTTTAPHGLVNVGQSFWYVLAGITPAAYNKDSIGQWITGTSPTTFTYPLVTNPGSAGTGGAVYATASSRKIHLVGNGNTPRTISGGAGSQETLLDALLLDGSADDVHFKFFPYHTQSGLLLDNRTLGQLKTDPTVPTMRPDTWYTFTAHYSIGHWYRGNVLGWPAWRSANANERIAARTIPLAGSARSSGNLLGVVTIAAASKTLTRSYGSWIVDGFSTGVGFQISGAVHPANNGRYSVASATATSLVVNEPLPGGDENPSTFYLQPIASLDVDPADPNGMILTVSNTVPWGDADLLPVDTTHYPGSTGFANAPGPITYLYLTDAAGTINYNLLLLAKPSPTSWRVQRTVGGRSPGLPLTGLIGVAAHRMWRDSTIEWFLTPDGGARTRVYNAFFTDDRGVGLDPGPGIYGYNYYGGGTGNANITSGATNFADDPGTLTDYSGAPVTLWDPYAWLLGQYVSNSYFNNRNGLPTVDTHYWIDEILVSTQPIADPA